MRSASITGASRLAWQIDGIEATLPMQLALLVEILLLQGGVDVDAYEFRAQSWIKRRC